MPARLGTKLLVLGALGVVVVHWFDPSYPSYFNSTLVILRPPALSRNSVRPSLLLLDEHRAPLRWHTLRIGARNALIVQSPCLQDVWSTKLKCCSNYLYILTNNILCLKDVERSAHSLWSNGFSERATAELQPLQSQFDNFDKKGFSRLLWTIYIYIIILYTVYTLNVSQSAVS